MVAQKSSDSTFFAATRGRTEGKGKAASCPFTRGAVRIALLTPPLNASNYARLAAGAHGRAEELGFGVLGYGVH
jgi:hypothetical protein